MNPKIKIENYGRQTNLWLNGVYMGPGITKVEFSHEACKDGVLKLEINSKDFTFDLRNSLETESAPDAVTPSADSAKTNLPN